MGVVGPRLGDLPVLTELAVEITSGRREGEGAAGGKDVKERLLLDGVDVDGARVAINERVIEAIYIFTNAAVSPFAWTHLAEARTEFTPDMPPGKLSEKG
jgi:hypothetical protein